MKQTDNTSDCQMRESLVAYLYNEATAEERGLVETHLSACPVCKQEMAAFERVRGMLGQWQLDDLPVVRVETRPARKPSVLEAIKELIVIMPVWAKALGAVAAAMIVLAALGTEVSIDGNGFRMRASLFQTGAPVNTVSTALNESDIERLRADLKTMVNTMVAQSERQQQELLKAQLASFESQLQNIHATDMAKLAETIHQQRARLRIIERDIDRREGLDLADILFSELNDRAGERSAGRTRGSD